MTLAFTLHSPQAMLSVIIKVSFSFSSNISTKLESAMAKLLITYQEDLYTTQT